MLPKDLFHQKYQFGMEQSYEMVGNNNRTLYYQQ